VGIALDDFGTGYSSLGHLRDLPLAGVKIDSSFVAGLGRNEHGAAIVAAIVSLTRALGLEAVAEGVESQRQANLLRELGCPLGQGYLFGAPGPGIG
jgi:EAL domain-containing protein (putative c-di-GMP-specific phosphodiesterase class I)